MDKSLIVTCFYGDPKNPKTWSGTPCKLIKVLEDRGINIYGIDSGIYSFIEKAFFYFIHKFTREGFNFRTTGGFNFREGIITKKYSAYVIKRKAKNFDANIILHTSMIDVSGSSEDLKYTHFWLGDYTWNLRHKSTLNSKKFNKKMFLRMEKIERDCQKQIKHFFPISEYVKKNLINHYGIEPSKITIVRTGRGEIKPFTGEKSYTNGKILMVAKHRFEDKGGGLLLKSFEIAQKRNKNLKLVIIGDEKYKEQVGNLQNVTVTGFIPWEELQNHFNTASLFAMPALNEPWGLVYLEALACKTPILGLNRNSLPEITQDGKFGFLVDEPDPSLIADKILDAFSAPNRLKEMGEKGQNYTLNMYSWEKTVNKIQEVIF